MQSTVLSHAGHCGFSQDTEILTRQGWLRFNEVTRTDEMATRSEGGYFEWQRPARITWEPYSGKMVALSSRSLDALVAPHHPVLWSPAGGALGLERISPARDLAQRTRYVTRPRAAGCVPATSIWDAPDMTEKVFPGTRRTRMGPKPRDVRMTGDQFAAFMGMYTSEGSATASAHDWLVSISQTVGSKGYEEYRRMLTSICGLEPGRTGSKGSWILHSRALYEYLKPLGRALDKWLPREVLDLSRRQLGIFWHYYFLGDGSSEKHHGRSADQQVAATASPELAGQLQEIVQKLGYSCSARECETRATSLVPTTGIIFKLRIRTTFYPAFQATEVPYSAMVGCVSVPNGVVYTRRNGHPMWAGSI